MNSVITHSQQKSFGPKFFTEDGQKYSITAKIRYDDKCKNGHNSFSITGEINEIGNRHGGSCCCIYEEIARHFPELEKYIKWHLMSSDGPLHYVANTVYLAGDRDCWGNKRLEQEKDRNGILLWHDQNTFKSVIASETAPPEYLPVLAEGKERELDAARRTAIWPEATDEQFCLPPEELKSLLLARLPGLIEEFKKDVESLGFVF